MEPPPLRLSVSASCSSSSSLCVPLGGSTPFLMAPPPPSPAPMWSVASSSVSSSSTEESRFLERCARGSIWLLRRQRQRINQATVAKGILHAFSHKQFETVLELCKWTTGSSAAVRRAAWCSAVLGAPPDNAVAIATSFVSRSTPEPALEWRRLVAPHCETAERMRAALGDAPMPVLHQIAKECNLLVLSIQRRRLGPFFWLLSQGVKDHSNQCLLQALENRAGQAIQPCVSKAGSNPNDAKLVDAVRRSDSIPPELKRAFAQLGKTGKWISPYHAAVKMKPQPRFTSIFATAS